MITKLFNLLWIQPQISVLVTLTTWQTTVKLSGLKTFKESVIWKGSFGIVCLCYTLCQLCGSKGRARIMWRFVQEHVCWAVLAVSWDYNWESGLEHLFVAFPCHLGFLTVWWLGWKGEREGRGGWGRENRAGEENGREGEESELEPEREREREKAPIQSSLVLPQDTKIGGWSILYLKWCSIFILLYTLNHL